MSAFVYSIVVSISAESKRVLLLKKIDALLGSSYDLHKVIRKIFHEISRLMDTSNFYLAIYHRKENTISFEIYTIDGEERKVSSRKLSKGLTEYVIRTKRPLRINEDVKKICRKFGIKPIGKDAKSWLGVPMIYKNNVEGVITIQDYKHTKAYSPTDESFLMSIASRAAVVIANTRLIEEEMKRAKELALMNQIVRRLTRSLHVGDILETVTKSITMQFKKYNVSIFLVEDKQLVLKKLSKGFRDEIPSDLRLKFGEGVVGVVAKKGKTIVINDVVKNSRYKGFGQHTKSEVCIPLKISKKTIGVLNIECNEVNAFDENSVRILELIADRLSVTLHNARLYQEATDHAKELAVSFTIAQSLISTLELDDVLHRILEAIRNTFGFANIAILLIDKEKNELYIKASYGYSTDVLRNVRLKIGMQGICGHVAATGKVYYAADVAKVSFYVMGKKSVKSEAAIPLQIKGAVIGVLDIESDELNAFSDRDLRMFSIFASQAAVAIENARLFDETKELSLTDGLTKIANRRHFDLMLDREIRKAKGYSRPLSLAMVDLDNFKKFNDKYGHLNGDKMLIHIAHTLKRNIRDSDFVARYGGEEFVILFPELGDVASLKVLERIRNAVEKKPLMIKGVGKKKMTVSIGIATYPYNSEDARELVRNADKALYRAKQLGKNRVELAQGVGS